jgi:hypothetical protein
MPKTAHNRSVYASPLKRLGVRSARSHRSHASLTHIPARRVATQRFMGGLERHIQPERYMQFCPESVDKIRKTYNNKTEV